MRLSGRLTSFNTTRRVKMKFKSVMFDLDGTLLDTIGGLTNAVNMTMREFGYPEHSKESVRSFINNGAYRLIQLAVPKEFYNDDEQIKKVLARYTKLYFDNAYVDTKPYDGCVELLNRLKSEGLRLALVSNKPDDSAKAMTRHYFGDVFEYISGSGLGLPTKPEKECIDRALAALGIERQSLLYVGDSVVDVQTAHNSELPCAGVTWGFHGMGGFGDETPEFYVNNTDELYKVITTASL